jgi:hypothetical protein
MVSYLAWMATTNYSCKCTIICVLSVTWKYIIANEIIKISDINMFLVILNEKVIKCIINFGRFVKF